MRSLVGGIRATKERFESLLMLLYRHEPLFLSLSAFGPAAHQRDLSGAKVCLKRMTTSLPNIVEVKKKALVLSINRRGRERERECEPTWSFSLADTHKQFIYIAISTAPPAAPPTYQKASTPRPIIDSRMKEKKINRHIAPTTARRERTRKVFFL